MKILSVSEFSNYCDILNPSCYVFSTDNQPKDAFHNTFKVVARYKIMITSINPDCICFKNESSCVCFEGVKRIVINSENQDIGTVFTIVCGDVGGSLNEISYKLIAD